MTDEILAYYCLPNGGDGSCSLKLFKTREALDKYLELLELSEYSDGEMSEGGGRIRQSAIDNAYTVEDVIREFNS